MISSLLKEPLLGEVDLDSEERIVRHREILEKKPLMKGVCREVYAKCAELDERFFTARGQRVELGAGVSFIKEFFPEVLVTDIVPASHLDMTLDAQEMKQIEAESVRAFYGIHCFHHLPEPRRFFRELQRTLAPGGGAVIIDPYFGFISRLIYPRLFASERFDMNQKEWDTSVTGAMSEANQALSYVVLFRDREQFSQEFPDLEIVHADQLTNYLRYILSGGLNFRSLVPNALAPLLKLLEGALSPLRNALAIHHVVVLRKR